MKKLPKKSANLENPAASRTIKFRIWSEILKQFFTSGWVSADGSQILYLHGDQIEIVNNPKIQQFTGLLDKNNLEIFEGDFVKFIGGGCMKIPRLIVFENGCFVARSGEWIFHLVTANPAKIQIIGNIFENPELLKK